jgi:hypothetical protein
VEKHVLAKRTVNAHAQKTANVHAKDAKQTFKENKACKKDCAKKDAKCCNKTAKTVKK